ncbi:hypothetical protein [Nocardia salmonicida]|uniref:hypothetical protein n=1 Tax=Nocardia salmonicida TaxID=53431 RepID=UPI0037BD924A
MRRPHARASAALAGLAAVLLTVTGCGGGEDASSPPTATGPDINQAPASVTWRKWQGVALPIGAKDGPKRTDVAATGYTPTPQGAALAAIQHSVRTSLAPDDSWPKIAAQSLAEGPGKNEWVTARVLVSIKKTDPAVAPKISGYKITDWTPDRSSITVFTTYPDASVLATDTVVVWIADDWRLLFNDPATKTVFQHDIPSVPADAVRLEAKS